MSNRLQYETSPYLLQHAENPVDWYPWGEEAFEKAKREDKPVFLSIGYSTCHWCHVMARESFEDAELAALLNRSFVSVKVDREERPDIDSVYMRFCMAFTGSGGWPTSILMTADQKPFFAGTYFPRHSRNGMPGLYELLTEAARLWRTDRQTLLQQADRITEALQGENTRTLRREDDLSEAAYREFEASFDAEFGGFGPAPKFPAAHNLLFLLAWARKTGTARALEMVEKTLLGMYRGGLYDHIGGGWCRYSTDRRFLVPHFEKMLYDNALLILAACRCAEETRNPALSHLLQNAAERTGAYVLREMTAPEGGFYSAQDADSGGEEGSYYLFTPEEAASVLPRDEAAAFQQRYDVTEQGNFHGKSIPNLLHSDPFAPIPGQALEALLCYRSARMQLHTDKKILTAWNGLMITAFCGLYRLTQKDAWLRAARAAEAFLRNNVWKAGRLFAVWTSDRLGKEGFLEDYAALQQAELALYAVSGDPVYLQTAETLCQRIIPEFEDREAGGYFFYGGDGETLLLRPKETYDGAMPSGNSMMAWNLVRLAQLTEKPVYEAAADRQFRFLASRAAACPAGSTGYLLAKLMRDDPLTLKVVRQNPGDPIRLSFQLPPEAAIRYYDEASRDYPLVNGRTTYYLCGQHRCFPPTNDPEALLPIPERRPDTKIP